MEGFIEGFEVLKLRIEKLKKLTHEFDSIVSPTRYDLLQKITVERKRMIEQITKDIERANADIKNL